MKIRKILISILFAVILVFACGKVQANKILKDRPKFSLEIDNEYLYIYVTQLTKKSLDKDDQINFSVDITDLDNRISFSENFSTANNKVFTGKVRSFIILLNKDEMIKIITKTTLKYKTEQNSDEIENKDSEKTKVTEKKEIATRTEYLYLKAPDLNTNFSKSNVIEATSKNRLKNLIINVKDNKDTLIKTITLTPTELLDGKTKYAIKGQDQTKTEELDDNKYNKLFINQDYWNKMKINYGTKLTITATDVYGFTTTKEIDYVYPVVSDVKYEDGKISFYVDKGSYKNGEKVKNEIKNVSIYKAGDKNSGKKLDKGRDIKTGEYECSKIGNNEKIRKEVVYNIFVTDEYGIVTKQSYKAIDSKYSSGRSRI